MRRRRRAGAVPRGLAGAIAVVLLAAAGSAWAQDKPATQGKPAKVSHDLLVLEREYAALAGAVGTAQANALFKPSRPGLRVAGGLVTIDAVAGGDPATLLANLRALGLQNGKAFGRIVSGRLPIAAISAMAALPSLRFARPAIAATRTGSVTSQGDVALRADVARATYGLTGSGVMLGTLSDSYNCLGGAAGDVASGDLPAGVVVLEELTGCVDASDEGRAMMQIIHDVAPGTSQAFHSAFNGMASFAQGIVDLASAGAKVIVDDVIYFAEPMFQDGIVAQAVDTVAGMGVAYFSAAGNEARRSYEHAFTPGLSFGFGAFPSAPDAPLFFGGIAHDFGGGDLFQQITIPASRTAAFAFQWDQPFFSVSGAPGSASDYDLYLFNDPPTTVLFAGVAPNVGGDPTEVFTWTTAGTPLTANLMIVKFGAGPAAGKLKYVITPSSVTINEFATNSSTTYGHANAAGATAVGAARFDQTPAFGQSPPLLEPFSSAGGTPILFLPNGTPTSVTRQKPEIVAPDGGNTTFFFAPSTVDGDPFPNFFGTSAAAPHASGVAALMRQRNSTISPADIRSILQSTAINMEDPGFDFNTGFGLIQADAAVAAVPLLPEPPPPPPPPPPATPKTFTVAPCRVADTRFSAMPGPVAAGQTINQRLKAPLDGQGGAPDCGVPATATGVFINVVAVGASGAGHLTVFPFGSPAPVASNLNFTTGQTIAGSTLVPVCTPAAGCPFDISVLMGPAAAHLVIDITGYLSLP